MAVEKNLLVIAYLFPPSGAVGAQRIARFCRYLPMHGVRATVLTVRGEYYERQDESLVDPGLEVVRTAMRPTLLQAYGGWKARSRPPAGDRQLPAGPGGGAPGESRGWLRRQILSLLLTPDPQRGWRVPAVGGGQRLLKRRRFDAILSSGPPWTSHLVARRLKRVSGLPWIADFRDPWSHTAGPGAPRWKPRLDARLESGCVVLSDLVICNTEELRGNFAARYPDLAASRFATITNGFDDAASGGPPPTSPGPRLCLHLGSLYGKRRVDAFCRALDRLLDSGLLRPGELKIAFVGEADEDFPKIAAEHGPRALATGMIEFLPAVPRAAAQDLLNAADLLLLFQGSYRLQVPAKFYEYLPTGKPMFAVTEAGALSRLLDATGSGVWAAPDDVAAIAAQFMRALQLPATPAAEAVRRWERSYHFRSLAGQLAERIHALTA